MAQIFGQPPEEDSVAHGLPHPSEIVDSFWSEIEQSKEPRFPLRHKPGLSSAPGHQAGTELSGGIGVHQ